MDTPYGKVIIEPKELLFEHIAAFIEETARDDVPEPVVGLTGGSTPKAFYEWTLERQRLSADELAPLVWTVSDERMVELEDPESNFGNADRMFLDPLDIDSQKKFPWPVQVDPHSASVVLNRKWGERFGFARGMDLCFLGMGDDGHTASIFPGSPLLEAGIEEPFSCVEVPDKGWRLTLTEKGISQARRIVVVVTGAGKAERVAAVFKEAADHYPVQLLGRFPEKVIWLMDPEAAAKL